MKNLVQKDELPQFFRFVYSMLREFGERYVAPSGIVTHTVFINGKSFSVFETDALELEYNLEEEIAEYEEEEPRTVN